MNRNKLKSKVTTLIQEKGITNYNSMCLSIPEEKYIKSIVSLLSTINSKNINQFLLELEEVLLRKNFPLLSMDTVMLLYTRWLKYPESCSVLIYFSKKTGNKKITQEELKAIIYKIHYQSNDLESLLNKCFIVAQCFRKGLIKSSQNSEWVEYIKAIMSVPMSKSEKGSSRRSVEKRLLIQYDVFFQWSELIISNHPEDIKKANYLLKKMISRHFRVLHTLDQLDAKFSEYISSVNELVNYQYIFYYSTEQLLKIQEIYSVRPDLFTESWLGIQKRSEESIFQTIFSKFKVPPLFVRHFFVLTNKEKQWLLHLLQGGSLRHLSNLPLPVTRKAMNVFLNLQPKAELSIKEGMLHASLLALGVDRVFSLEVVNNIRNYRQSAFWVKHMSVFYFKGLAPESVGEVMDYMAHCEFQENRGISWKHKSVKNLVQESNQWHTQIFMQRSFRNRKNLRFKSSRLEDFSFTSSDASFVIKQLKSGYELFEEGSNLNHCVYSYQHYCKRGESEIFSLRKVINDLTEKPLLTIEVRMNRIVQVRGNYNRSPKQNEWEIIKFWAGDQCLKIAC